MSAWSAIFLIEKILALALIQQTVELLMIRKTWTLGGIWDGKVLKQDFSGPHGFIIKLLLGDSSFTGILLLRLILAALLFFSSNPFVLWTLLGISLLILLRWRGTFNGGSDAMTSLVLLGLCLATTFPQEKVLKGCLWYISIQVCLSYFISGLQKIRRPEWHTGKALQGFLSSTTLDTAPSLRSLIQNPRVSFAFAWVVMLFECLFPLALLNSTWCVLFIVGGFLFHTLNTYALGLNRFVLAWAAAYPALYFCSQIW